jgi:hypothetical protein
MSRSGTAEEPRLFTLDPIPVCLHFTLFALIPATLTLSQPGGPALPVILTIQPQKNCLYPLLEPRSTSLKKANSYMLALVALIGLGDETLQWILPNRYVGLVDLVVNTATGLFTLAFIGFVLGEENYPWGPQPSKM